MMMMMTMQMTFYWGKDVTILFDFWRVDTVKWYVVSLLVVFLFSLLHQFLASLRSALRGKPEKEKEAAVTAASIEDGDHRTPSVSTSHVRKAVAASLFGVYVGLGYLLMLAAMTFNGGVFVAIVAGLASGHFLFCSSNSLDGGDSACGAI